MAGLRLDGKLAVHQVGRVHTGAVGSLGTLQHRQNGYPQMRTVAAVAARHFTPPQRQHLLLDAIA